MKGLRHASNGQCQRRGQEIMARHYIRSSASSFKIFRLFPLFQSHFLNLFKLVVSFHLDSAFIVNDIPHVCYLTIIPLSNDGLVVRHAVLHAASCFKKVTLIHINVNTVCDSCDECL